MKVEIIVDLYVNFLIFDFFSDGGFILYKILVNIYF